MNIAIYNHKGGVGKSTLATHLGFYARDNKIDTTVIDFDRQRNTISWLTGHQWNGDENYQDKDSPLFVTISDMNYNSEHIIYDCPPSDNVIKNLVNDIDYWLIPIDGRFSVTGAMDVINELRDIGKKGEIFIIMNKGLNNSFGKKEREEIHNKGLKVFYLEIPQADVVRKAETYGWPVWEIPYSSRSLATENIKLFCKWVYNGFKSKQLV